MTETKGTPEPALAARQFPIAGLAKGLASIVMGLTVANCSSGPQRVASSRSSEIGAFPQAKYGPASPRVVADGADVPKGGGRYQVGRPYSVAGRTYVPREMNGRYSATGTASWYGDAFHGRRTANGEVFDRHSITAAHPTMPLPSYARVTNLANGRSIVVRVNDRGPYHGGRVMDVSQRVADALEFRHLGTARIKVDHLGAAGLAGSDDKKLLASLTTGGQPASLPGYSPQVQVASADPSFTPVLASSSQMRVLSSRPALAAPLASQPEGAESEADKVAATEAEEVTPPQAPLASVEPSSGSRQQASGLEAGSSVPLPPERPYDFGAISAPVKVQNGGNGAQPSGQRQQAVLPRVSGPIVTAASYYAAPSDIRTRFAKNDPFSKLDENNFKAEKTSGSVPLNSGFYVGVGVFRQEANAKRMTTSLGTGVKSYITSSGAGQTAIYRVEAGPFADLTTASSVQLQAKTLGAADARVIRR